LQVPTVLTLSALVIRDDAGRLLLVRKRGTSKFMQPGGKLEPGESFAAAAVRELQEELGIRVATTELTDLGRWYGAAANEADTFIDAGIFSCDTHHAPVAAAEIEEVLWLHPDEAKARDDLAPLLTDHILPLLAEAAAWSAHDCANSANSAAGGARD
jgi:8-oxo-dGTP diphosphatase